MAPSSAIALTVDVEDYFHVEAFSKVIDMRDWEKYPSRVEGNTEKLLAIFESFGAIGTFFVLGWVARRFPGLVKRISAGGHEIGSHGDNHRMATAMTPEVFRNDVRDSKRILEDIVGTSILGYRAPTFSILEETSWTYEILLQEGYRYSTSVFPIRHDRYGWPRFGLVPRQMASDGNSCIWEIPLSVARIGSANIPFGGGGYLRAYPIAVTKTLFRRIGKRGQNGIIYIHPWEIDSNQPEIDAPWICRLRHRQGIPGMEHKIREILKTFRVCKMTEILPAKLHPQAIH